MPKSTVFFFLMTKKNSTKNRCQNRPFFREGGGSDLKLAYTQGLTELNPRATVMSIDGISAYDLVSRESMLQALADVEAGSQALPFVSMFYGATVPVFVGGFSRQSAHHQTG